MKSQLRHLVADALYPIKAHTLPAVCERYGLEPGDGSEAFSSKTRFVMTRLEKLSDDKVFAIAKEVVRDYPDDRLQAAIEQLDKDGHLVSDITRDRLAKALDEFSLAGSRDLLELLRAHWPSVDKPYPDSFDFRAPADDIIQHAVRNDDWSSSEVLDRAGFFSGSQSKLFRFLEDLIHPRRRNQEEQQQIVAKLNPILRRDGYTLIAGKPISGYPTYKIIEVAATGTGPADELISKTLISFDESGVHQAWQKALERRANDPEGAITAAKTLLETVCKHIVDEAGGSYGENDDLPKLYHAAAEHLNLAPSQHTEPLFKTILGNCQSVVGTLAGLRNKLGDAHGQGKRQVKPHPRHAELAVNLAGSAATFLISTWNARKPS
jgi:AbiJ-like protein/abortive infection Abi-like protein